MFPLETRTAQSFPSPFSLVGVWVWGRERGTSRGYCGDPRGAVLAERQGTSGGGTSAVAFASGGPMHDPHWPLIPYWILTLSGGKEATKSICKYFSPTTRVLLTP